MANFLLGWAFYSTYGLEVVAAILSLGCVVLAAKNNVWNWPLAMVASVLYTVVFYRACLYSDAFLNILFLLFQGFGLWQWIRPKANGEKVQTPVYANAKEVAWVIGLALVFYFPWVKLVEAGIVQQLLGQIITGEAMDPRFFPSPRFLYLDAFLLFLSLIALYMQSQRWIQNWWIWIVVDLIYVPIYAMNHNWVTAVLYLIYIPIAVKGYLHWQHLQNNTEKPTK